MSSSLSTHWTQRVLDWLTKHGFNGFYSEFSYTVVGNDKHVQTALILISKTGCRYQTWRNQKSLYSKVMSALWHFKFRTLPEKARLNWRLPLIRKITQNLDQRKVSFHFFTTDRPSMYWPPPFTNKEPENPARLIFRSGVVLLTVLAVLNINALNRRLGYLWEKAFMLLWLTHEA